MSSTSVREPIGPRSVDEMLAEVYGRAARTRRRRHGVAVMGAAAATLVTAAALSFVGSDGDSAQVRTAGRSDAEARATVETSPTTSTPAPSDSGPGTGGRPAPSKKDSPSGGRREAALPPPADGPVQSPSVPAAPDVRLLRAVEDASGDATPGSWYLDIVRGSAEHDSRRQALVFTTAFRDDGAGDGDREEHTVTSRVQYDNSLYELTVVERGNRLGDVKLDARACDGCTARFDAAQARLVVTVPLATFNAAVTAGSSDNVPFGPGSSIDDFVVRTVFGNDVAGLQADTTAQEVAP